METPDLIEPDVRFVDVLTLWVRKLIEKQFERVFVVVTLASVMAIGYFVDNKLAFINFLYIPVFLAASLLGTRSAVLGAVLSFLIVTLYAILDPDQFMMDPTNWNLFSHLLAWGCFLILTGALVGRLNEKLSERYQKAKRLVEDLTGKQIELERLQTELLQNNRELEVKTQTVETLKEKVESVLFSTMDPEVARLVVNRQLSNEKKVISVLFADIEGFTTFSEGKQPELVIEELNKFFNLTEPILHRFHGHLDKFIGDGLMAEFGTPMLYQQHALQGVLAALHMQNKIAESHLALKMRIGFSTGPSIMGLVGSERRKSYSAFGDTVNLAQRLEMLCPAGSLLIDDATYQRVFHIVAAKKFRVGIGGELLRQLERMLAELEVPISQGQATWEDYLRVGNLNSELGEMDAALSHLKKAMQLPDANREELEKAIAQTVLREDTRSKLSVKGKKMRVVAYEVSGIKDSLQDANKIPAGLRKAYHELVPNPALIRDMILAIEALDCSIGQSRSTALLAFAAADAMGLSAEVKDTVLMAGYLHHVGKKFIPDHLLNRDDAEYDLQVMTGHIVEAPRVIAEMGLKVSEKVLEAIRHHHEIYSGGGYPSGLKGEAIPLSSRIIQVASQYDTLTSWKPHRDAWSREGALNELKREAKEGRYDPKVVEGLWNAIKAHS